MDIYAEFQKQHKQPSTQAHLYHKWPRQYVTLSCSKIPAVGSEECRTSKKSSQLVHKNSSMSMSLLPFKPADTTVI